MDEEGGALGRIRRVGGSFEGHLERLIAHKPGDVWRMLTDPERLAQWLAPGSIELRVGGAVRIDFADSGTTIDSTVTELDPGRLLAYSWSSGNEPKRPLRWELIAVEAGTRVVLTVQIPLAEDMARACAGFDTHLEMMAAALEGVPIRFPLQHFLKVRDAYRKLLEGQKTP